MGKRKPSKWEKFEKKNDWWLDQLTIEEQVRIRNAYLGIHEVKQLGMIDCFWEWMGRHNPNG